MENEGGVVSTQVLQELAVNLRRKLTIPGREGDARDRVGLLGVAGCRGRGDSILEALDIEARYQVSFWDALVIQAAHAAGAEILYFEDLSNGQVYGDVRVRNSFAGMD